MAVDTVSPPGPAATARRTIVVGLGNPILGDDGVGWRVAEEVARRSSLPVNVEAGDAPVAIECLSVGGLTLMEHLVGWDRAVLVDSVVGGGCPLGTIRCSSLASFHRPLGHLDSSHDASLPDAIAAGRAVGAVLPDEITVVAVETERCETFGEALSPPVEAAVQSAASLVADLLDGYLEEDRCTKPG